MIEIGCPCGATLRVGEDDINAPSTCDGCGASTTYACAEALPAGAGAGDFDVALVVRGGPARHGTQVALGGVADIGVGKADGKLVQLLGQKVSRNHAALSRVDFGPGRWAIRDLGSTNGTFVNGERLERDEPFTLSIGDRVNVGEFEFEVRDATAVAVPAGAGGGVADFLKADPDDGFELAEEPAPIKPPPVSRLRPVEAAPTGPAKPCPRCKAMLKPGAKFCVGCGTDLATGKRAVLSKDIDENQLYITTESIVGPLSWILRLGLFPIASVALGSHKPVATWAITGLTALCSILFMFAVGNANQMHEISPGTANLMLWSGQSLQAEVEEAAADAAPWTAKDRAEARQQMRRLLPRASQREIDQMVAEMEAESNGEAEADAATAAEQKSWREQVGFRPYQLVTHAFLHDFSGWIAMVLHFGGNLLFLLVFGLRVNELIGQWRFVVSYLVLAIGAGLAQHIASSGGPAMPMVGASGAIMGLAGMYLVLFPRQKVYMVFWARLGLLTGFRLICKIWQMPGFWLLVAWIAWNDGVPILVRHMLKLPDTGGVGHWAHVGGFVCGVALALVWLLTRQVHAHGHDLISNLLGPKAASVVRQA